MKKKKIQIKLSLRKKVRRKLTWKNQSSKLFKNIRPTWDYPYVIKARTFGILSAKKIEVARILLRRSLFKKKPSREEREKKETKVWKNTPMNRVFTKKSSNQRMGKGKGAVKGRFSTVFPGKILFQLKKGALHQVKKAFIQVKNRMPFKIFLLFRKALVN